MSEKKYSLIADMPDDLIKKSGMSDRTLYKCVHCNHRWIGRKGSGEPKTCANPECRRRTWKGKGSKKKKRLRGKAARAA